jgi:hypothetical protein
MKTIARWESRGGAYFAELYKAEGSGYYYKGSGCGGYLGNDVSEEQALAMLEARCAPGAGFFQPDNNKTPMRRVEVTK